MRKKRFTKSEVMLKLKQNDDNVAKAVEEIVTDLSPFDVEDESVILLEDRVQRLSKVSMSLTKKLYRLKKEVKDRKYRKKPELLEETEISCSQYSVLQSETDDSEHLCESLSQSKIYQSEAEDEEEADEKKQRPTTYAKKTTEP